MAPPEAEIRQDQLTLSRRRDHSQVGSLHVGGLARRVSPLASLDHGQPSFTALSFRLGRPRT